MHSNSDAVILTGDRTTGPLHLGHYVGSLRNRVTMQEQHRQFLLLADLQALTDNSHDTGRIRKNVLEIVADYLAVGIDPSKSTICVQSNLPALAELTILYLNFVTVSRLERNPTIKEEIRTRGFERDVPAGFLCYPISQAADITGFMATIVPVGEDQAPLIEQTNEIVRRINHQVGRDLLNEVEALIPRVGRLPGIDGKSKMSKSYGNAIPLTASSKEIDTAVNRMFTDPNHLRVSDPGKVEGNVVFTYLDAFDPNKQELEDLKAQYRRGGLGDMVLKKRLAHILNELLEPIRERRLSLKHDPDYLLDVVCTGTRVANEITQETLLEVRDALGIFELRGGCGKNAKAI